MLSFRRHLPLSLTALLLTLGLSACRDNPAQVFSPLDPSSPIKIAVAAQQAEGVKVVVEGKVVAIAPLVKQSVYELQDDSGVIWVLTDSQPPTQKTTIKIHGIIRSSNGERYIDQK
ncbi:hypothetical protein IQ266_02185 [filamentous cyanobacterium LEGE 11480]|uniref:Lipoprotein n=1 Tax=Romeriopsis navalis LEGE 11480 TaxID=2777977 RepID=A0A928Z2N8_9CYAN|nr:hypothetical protein [Romeriopsis navalis]MBE9028565.1 hypothetical protein [Romeriopsis navalis LEGE 11480]